MPVQRPPAWMCCRTAWPPWATACTQHWPWPRGCLPIRPPSRPPWRGRCWRCGAAPACPSPTIWSMSCTSQAGIGKRAARSHAQGCRVNCCPLTPIPTPHTLPRRRAHLCLLHDATDGRPPSVLHAVPAVCAVPALLLHGGAVRHLPGPGRPHLHRLPAGAASQRHSGGVGARRHGALDRAPPVRLVLRRRRGGPV